jgi:hypothetical protein
MKNKFHALPVFLRSGEEECSDYQTNHSYPGDGQKIDQRIK